MASKKREMSSRSVKDPKYITYLLNPKEEYDWYFVVGNKKKDKAVEKIGVVKKMLLAHSEVFRKELQESQLIEKNCTPITDIFPDTFRNLLRYIYGYDNTASLSFEDADDLLYAADKYMMSELRESLASRLIDLLSYENICSLLNNPACFQVLELKSEINKILQCETGRVLASPQFPDLSSAGFLAILEQEKLQVTEIELWRSAVQWAKNKGNIQKITSCNQEKTIRFIEEFHARPVLWDVTCAEYKNRNKKRDALQELANICETAKCDDGAELRKELTTHLPHIRVCTVSHKDFCREIMPTRVLTDSEMFEVCLYHGNDAHKPALTEICDVTEPRAIPFVKSDLLMFDFSYNSLYSTSRYTGSFEVRTREHTIELCSLYTYSIIPHDCTVEITELDCADPSSHFSMTAHVQAPNFNIDLPEDNQSCILKPNSKYKITLRSTTPLKIAYNHNSYGGPRSILGDHFNVKPENRNGYYISCVKSIHYKTPLH